MSGVAVGLGALAARGAGSADLRAVALAAACGMLITAGGNTLNDASDAKVDRVNHPRRPVPSGQISVETARLVAISELAAGLALGWSANIWCGLIAAFAVLTLSAYEWRLKNTGLPGNVAVSLLTGLLFVTGGAAAGALAPPTSLALLAFVATLGREVAKDIEDVAGDTTRRTWPMRVGIPAARAGAATLFGLAILLGPLPYLLGTLSVWYLTVAALAALGFARTIIALYRRPQEASRSAKLAMGVTLVAFLVGVQR